MKPKLSVETLRRLLTYNPGTGIFVWRPRLATDFSSGVRSAAQVCAVWNARYANTQAGWRRRDGYPAIAIFDIDYRAHRIAWVMMTEEWPDHDIDHQDGNPMNCAWGNLRAATHQQNRLNNKIYSNNSSGCPGVAWKPDKKKWRARIRLASTDYHLGYFDTLELAYNARLEAEHRMFGKFRRAQSAYDEERRTLR